MRAQRALIIRAAFAYLGVLWRDTSYNDAEVEALVTLIKRLRRKQGLEPMTAVEMVKQARHMAGGGL